MCVRKQKYHSQEPNEWAEKSKSIRKVGQLYVYTHNYIYPVYVEQCLYYVIGKINVLATSE